MKRIDKVLISLLVVGACASSPVALAQTTKNNETVGMPALNQPATNVGAAEKQEARKERRAEGSATTKDNMRNPVNNEDGKPLMEPRAKNTTSAERSAARRQRNADASQITKENMQKPMNNETGSTPTATKP